MKLSPHIGRTKTLVPREPVRTHAECAEMLRITSHQLSRFLQTRSGPAPEIETQAHYRSDLKYYRPSLMRKWWAGVQAADAATKTAAAHESSEPAAMKDVA